jgi:DNA-binding MarR family transcriptional regulator
VVRRGDPSDGRQSLLELTTAGLVALERDAALRERWLAGAMRAELTPAERQLLRVAAGLLDRLADAGELPSATRRRRFTSGDTGHE